MHRRGGRCRTLGRVLVWVVMLAVGLSFPAAAEASDPREWYDQQYAASGAAELWDGLSADTRRFLENIGINGVSAEQLTALQPEGVLQGVWSLMREQTSAPLATGAILMGIVLFAALLDGGGHLVRDDGVRAVFSSVCVLAAGGAVLVPLAGTLRAVSDTAQSIAVFMGSFVPVYAGILLTGGRPVGAASFQAITLFAAELMTWFVSTVLVPALTVSLVLAAVGSVTQGLKLDRAGGLINKVCAWALALTASLFAGLLSLQHLVGAATDSLSGRAIRFSLTSLVPVVGNALGEACSNLRGCLGLLQTTVGGFGMVAVALMVVPPLLTCFGWLLCFGLCGTTAEVLGNHPLPALCRSAAAVVRTMIGALAACGLFMIVAVALVSAAWGTVN